MGLLASNQKPPLKAEVLAKARKRLPSPHMRSWFELAMLQGLLSCQQINSNDIVQITSS
jgi:hypothetical protein